MNERAAELAAVVRESYPELEIAGLRLIEGDGQYNELLVVNESLIFRFPRYAPGVKTLQREIAFLGRIQGRTTLPVPDPEYLSHNGATPGRAFMGYRMIPGEPLWRERLQAIEDEETLQRLADQLALFLKELHSIPVGDAVADFPVEDRPEEWAQLHAEFRRHLYPHMRPDAREQMTRAFERFLGAPQLHDYDLALRHGDFGFGNILYDPESRSIGGIIDFGYAGLGDPAVDIASAMTLGDAFFGRFHVLYPEIESMLERARFYRSTYALMEALHGAKFGDEEAFESGISAYV